MRQEHKDTVASIQEYFRKRGFVCKHDFTLVRDDKSPIKNKCGRIDLCCINDQTKMMSCFEVEDSCFQVLKNRRDLRQVKKDYSKKGYQVRVCQLGSKENFQDKEVCG